MTEQIFRQREMRVTVEPKTTVVVYDPSDETYNFINGGCPKSKAEYEDFLKEELAWRDVFLIILILPSIDGNSLIKPKAKSTDRHKRETLSKVGEKVGLSVATFRRSLYIDKWGSEEIKQLCRSGQLSVWRAYNFVRRQQEEKLFELILAAKAKGEQP